jgi:sulfate transport system permease protein
MTARARRLSPALRTPAWLQAALIFTAVAFLVLFIGVPLAAVFSQALEKGAEGYFAALRDPDTISAIRLTLITALCSVSLNVVFGLAASWSIAKYDFVGKRLLTTLIDLPFSISPVISGLIFVLMFGRNGVFGEWLSEHDVKIIFAVPGIIIATTFVTFPFVAKEVLPLMQSQGNDAEEAALTLGATGWQVFRLVTLPKIRWGLVYGVILCNARAMGEFGAVSVVSGHIRGATNTLPLHVEILYNDNNLVGSFAVASLLTLLALVTLAARKLIEWRQAA